MHMKNATSHSLFFAIVREREREKREWEDRERVDELRTYENIFEVEDVATIHGGENDDYYVRDRGLLCSCYIQQQIKVERLYHGNYSGMHLSLIN